MHFPFRWLIRRLERTARRARLRRSWGLLRSFRWEQTRPELFYGALAQDTAGMIAALSGDAGCGDLAGQRVLDVGGGPGYFAAAFADRGAQYVAVEPDVGEMAAAGIAVPGAIRGSGMDLPIRSGCMDIAYSSNVAEHVDRPWRLGKEMLRVTRPGGLVVLSYTVWLGPFGGHETGLWAHYVGGAFAHDRYARRHGHPPKNVFGTSLFAVSCAAGLRWAEQVAAVGKAEVVGVFPRYHPWWAWWLVQVPVLREFAVSNLVIALKVPSA